MLGQNVFLFLLVGSITSSRASVVRLGELQQQSQTQEISGEVWINWENQTIVIKNFTDESSNGVILVGTRDLGINISEFTFNLVDNSTILNYTFNGSQNTYSLNKDKDIAKLMWKEPSKTKREIEISLPTLHESRPFLWISVFDENTSQNLARFLYDKRKEKSSTIPTTTLKENTKNTKKETSRAGLTAAPTTPTTPVQTDSINLVIILVLAVIVVVGGLGLFNHVIIPRFCSHDTDDNSGDGKQVKMSDLEKGETAANTNAETEDSLFRPKAESDMVDIPLNENDINEPEYVKATVDKDAKDVGETEDSLFRPERAESDLVDVTTRLTVDAILRASTDGDSSQREDEPSPIKTPPNSIESGIVTAPTVS